MHPQLPLKRSICFYPMSKRRATGANWYALPFDGAQAAHGRPRPRRTHATPGACSQLITGSTGLDDWEWGVTLLADDPVALKEIVYEMRFDPVSARLRATSVRSSPACCSSRPTRCGRVGLSTGVADRVEHVRLFVSFPEELVDRPMIYEIVKRFDVVPNIRRANVESHSGWVILELTASPSSATLRSRTSRGWAARSTHGRRRPRGMSRRRARA